LPDMPNGVVRVYPASGAVAMLPLTPANNYTPTILFCGGSVLTDEQWGDYRFPNANVWEIAASKDCQRLTAEPQDGSAGGYEQDDDMLDGRSMGQFIILPDGKLLVVNGGGKGMAAYSGNGTGTTAKDQMPFGFSLATDPVLKPAIYDPTAPKGSRWSNAGFSASKIPRLYHSTAILLPDASVMIAGSNPNPDVVMDALYPTTYKAEVFYPSYFSAGTRPSPQGVPTTLSYGGKPFDITIPSNSYTGAANKAADATTVTILRGGFTTHAMNMGQRFLQLNNTYTVNKDGSIVLHVAQVPPNPNLFQPGPAFLYVNINGIPSIGKYLIVGNGAIGTQPISAAVDLPASVGLDSVVGGGNGSSANNNNDKPDSNSESKSNMPLIIGSVAGGIAILIIGAIIGVCVARKKRAANLKGPSSEFAMAPTPGAVPWHSKEASMSASVLTPLQRTNYDDSWDPSTANLNAPYAPYRDDSASGRGSQVYEDGRYSPSPHNLQPMVPVDNYGQHDHPPTSYR